MTDPPGTYPTQTSVFCVELHRHLGLVDGHAGAAARKLHVLMGRNGTARDPDSITSLQEQLKGLAAERRQLLDMLNALGHTYPCRHDEKPVGD